jgi:adenylate cyclase
MRAERIETTRAHEPQAHSLPRLCREPRAVLIIDFAAFSRLPDDAIPVFHECVMRPVAEVMEAHEDGRLYDNSWGDAIIAIFEDAPQAARFALDLQDRLAEVPFGKLGLPPTLRPRIAGDFGRTWQGYDFVRKEVTFYGLHVTRAARLEPVTPPGAVYVTQAFALAASNEPEIACRYVGELATPKNFGVLSAYRLLRAGEGPWTASRS